MVIYQGLRRAVVGGVASGVSSLKTVQPSSAISNFGLLSKTRSLRSVFIAPAKGQQQIARFCQSSTPRRTFLGTKEAFTGKSTFDGQGQQARIHSSRAAPRTTRRSYGLTHVLLVATLSFVAGSYTIMSTISTQFLPRLTDAETVNAFQAQHEHEHEVEEYINKHPLVQSLRGKSEYTESRPHLKWGEEVRKLSLTAGALSGPGRIVVPPMVFTEDGGKSLVMVAYLGNEVCGYPGFIHGGLLATILDEGLARCSFQVLPNGLGMTANLNINYKKPAVAGQYIVLRARTTKAEGRKAWVEGHIETLPKNEGEEPVVLVEATGLFVEPRQVKMLTMVTGPITA